MFKLYKHSQDLIKNKNTSNKCSKRNFPIPFSYCFAIKKKNTT